MRCRDRIRRVIESMDTAQRASVAWRLQRVPDAPPEQPPVDEAPVEEELESDVPTDPSDADTLSAIENAIKSIMIKYQEENTKAQEIAFQEMKDAIALIKKDVVELSEQPADTPKRVIEQVVLNAKGRILTKLRNNK